MADTPGTGTAQSPYDLTGAPDPPIASTTKDLVTLPDREDELQAREAKEAPSQATKLLKTPPWRDSRQHEISGLNCRKPPRRNKKLFEELAAKTKVPSQSSEQREGPPSKDLNEHLDDESETDDGDQRELAQVKEADEKLEPKAGAKYGESREADMESEGKASGPD